MSPPVTIDLDPDHVTIVNVFRVRDGQQMEAAERLLAVNKRISEEPGFVSASVHRSLDGERVANYAQWRSAEAIRAALSRSWIAPLLASLAEAGEGDWHLYEVLEVRTAEGTAG